jgi:predicted dehydrogenase/nucleoside-diphosphate-sugar epimerase
VGKDQHQVGIVGAGYIAHFHKQAISRIKGVKLVAVCDVNQMAAERLALATEARVYTAIEEMLLEPGLDVVHVLTQPDSHFPIALQAIDAGKHVVLEKPATVDARQARELQSAAETMDVRVAVNHNFVFSRPFDRLKSLLDSGELGPLKSVRIVWKKPLAQLRSGPWNLWMLRNPRNILFETGSHSLSECLSIIDHVEIDAVEPRRVQTLPSGVEFFRRWSIRGHAGDVAVQIDLSLDSGYEQHLVEVEGMFGIASADIENDVAVVDAPTGAAYDLERLRVNTRAGFSRVSQALRTYGSYAGSKLFSGFTGGPYETSMVNGIANCYLELDGYANRSESSMEFACRVAETIERISQHSDLLGLGDGPEASAHSTVAMSSELAPRVLIVGASGFIGRRLLRGFQAQGTSVRALVRNASSLLGYEDANTQVVVGDYRDPDIARQALEDIDIVFHLAVSHGKSLSGYLETDSKPTLQFAERCLDEGVKRFIYSGTIDSLDLSSDRQITESDGVDSRLERRNNYAHSKALTEQALTSMHEKQGFPLVIVRPAIVLGAGGPVDHVGVANWNGLGRCTYWGNGRNHLPIVLVEDVVAALLRAADAPGIEGATFNLSSPSCISARDYVRTVEETLGFRVQAQTSSAVVSWLGDTLKWIVKVVARHPDRGRVPSVHDWKCREQHASFDVSNAKRALSWSPCEDREVLIEQGIRLPALEFMQS